jgi:hypothetical protein
MVFLFSSTSPAKCWDSIIKQAKTVLDILNYHSSELIQCYLISAAEKVPLNNARPSQYEQPSLIYSQQN